MASASHGWRKKNYRVHNIEVSNVTPMTMDENCLVLQQNLSSLVFWDCHSQQLFGATGKISGRVFSPRKILKQENNMEVPVLLGNLITNAAVLRNEQIHVLTDCPVHNFKDLKNAAVIDADTILLGNGNLNLFYCLRKF